MRMTMGYDNLAHPQRKRDMRKVILLYGFIHLLLTGFAQQNQNNGSRNNAKSIEIARSRSILLDKFIEKDELGVMLELDRILTLEDDDYISIYPVEYWLLSYWLKDYDVILSSCQSLQPDSLNREMSSIRIPPQQDYLTAKLVEKLAASKDSLISQISAASLTDEEKRFLRLNLAYLVPDDSMPEARRQQLNELSDQFLATYPNSNYSAFIREFIRIKYSPTRNGGGCFINLGKFLFTGNLSSYYKQPTFVGFGFDMVRNNWVYQLDIAINFSKSKTDMPSDNELWPENSKAIGGYAKLGLGKYVLDNQRLALAPLAGVGIFGMDPNTSSDEAAKYKGAGIKTSFAGSIGFMGDLKFKPRETDFNNFSGFYAIQRNFTSLRFGYEYIATPLKNKYLDYSGSVHKITLGLAFSTRRLQRSL